MKVLKGILLFLVSITWCISQTFVGAILALVLLPKSRVRKYRGMIVVYHPHSFTFSLGTFAFISDKSEFPRTAVGRAYGFYVQSLMYGPFFFLLVVLPRLIVRIPSIKRYRAERGLDPSDLFADRQAAQLQARFGE